MKLKGVKIKNKEVFADETNSVVLGKKSISGKRAGKGVEALTRHKIVRVGYTEPLRKQK